MKDSPSRSQRAAYYLAQHTDYNEGAHEESEELISMKQMALYLRYDSTAERAFNRDLHDLRKLQKDRRDREAQNEIGSVPQNAEPPAATPDPTPNPNPVHHSS